MQAFPFMEEKPLGKIVVVKLFLNDSKLLILSCAKTFKQFGKQPAKTSAICFFLILSSAHLTAAVHFEVRCCYGIFFFKYFDKPSNLRGMAFAFKRN